MAKAMDLSGDIDFDSLYQTVGLTWMDGDGWYTMSAVFTSGQYAVRWQPDGLEWLTEVNWNDEFIQPLGITNGDQGDWIVSKGGQYRVVFRVRGADRSTDDLVNIPRSGTTSGASPAATDWRRPPSEALDRGRAASRFSRR